VDAASAEVASEEHNDCHATARFGKGITVNFIKWILACVFDCGHRRTTWPHRDRRGLDYVCCLNCGRELPYSTRRMSIVTIEEQIEDRAFDRRAEWATRKVEFLPDFLETGSSLPRSLGVKCG
jgi:hypothetical protein